MKFREVFRERGFWGLCLLGAVYFHRPLFFGDTFFFRDLYLYYVPQKRLFVDLVSAGELPLWNPYLHGGLPFLADVSNYVFYPSNLLYFLLPSATALSVEIVLHVVAAAAAAYVLARFLGCRQPSAAIAGAVYGYCGLTLSNANLLVRLLATPYLPLMILFWHLALRERRRRWLVLTIGCGLLLVLAGGPGVIVVGFLTLLGWGLFCTDSVVTLSRRVGLWLVVCVAVAGLAAVQLLPMIEMVSQSERGQGVGLRSFGGWSLDPRRLPELVVAGFLGRTDSLADEDFWGDALVDDGFPYMLSIYLGAIPLVLAMIGGFRSRSRQLPRRLRMFLAALIALAVALALGRFLPFFALAYEWLPLVKLLRFPIKILSFAVLPVALLAALGTEVLFSEARDDRRHARRVLLAAGVTLGAVATFVLVATFRSDLGDSVQRFFFAETGPTIAQGLRIAVVRTMGFWLLAALVCLLARLRPRSWHPWFLAAIVLVDLMIGGRRVNPVVAAEFVAATPRAAQLVGEVLADGRLWRTRHPGEFPPSPPSRDTVWYSRWNQEVLNFYLGAAYRIPVIFHNDFHGLAPRRVMDLKRKLEVLPWERRLPILSAAAVRVIVTRDRPAIPGIELVGVIPNAGMPYSVYRNPHAASRVEFVQVWVSADSPQHALAAMLSPGFDPRRHAVLEAPAPEPPEAGCEADERVEIIAESSHRRILRIRTACSGLLVFSEVFYPGWEVVIDGEAAPLLRANGAFSAVVIDSGEHEVVWRYAPRTLYLGLGITALTAMILLGAGIAGRRGAR